MVRVWRLGSGSNKIGNAAVFGDLAQACEEQVTAQECGRPHPVQRAVSECVQDREHHEAHDYEAARAARAELRAE